MAFPSDEQLRARVDRLAGRLAALGWRLATAESCTGGWIAKCCTDRAGSSQWFERGVVSYSNEAKQGLLGVPAGVLERDGAVSEAAARAMADGVRAGAGVETALAVTGIAGPDGGSRDKPVGTVWFAWSVTGNGIEAECRRFEGDREAVRRQTVAHALDGLLARLPSVA